MEQDTRVCVYILIWNVNFLHKNNVVSKPAFAMGWGGMYHGENFEKMTQYGEFGCIFKISQSLYRSKHNYIVSVEGSSIILNV